MITADDLMQAGRFMELAIFVAVVLIAAEYALAKKRGRGEW